MKAKRIIPCLDLKDGRVVKGVNFLGLRDVASPYELGKLYSDSGADELALYDITASGEGRRVFSEIIRRVADVITIPLIVGGGVSTIEDFDIVLESGADKISINSGALKNPGLISEAAKKHGSGSVVLAIDVKRVNGEFHVFADGGAIDAGPAIEWIKRGESLGAGELVVNSIDTDGVKGGFDLPILEAVLNAVSIPIIASGGAGSIEDFIQLFKALPAVDAGLAASVFHFGEVAIPDLKRALRENGIEVVL